MFNINKSLLYDPGQVHYLVDSDYRTLAQGWSRADGTGPLDLWGARNPGYVFYAPGRTAQPSGATDAAALQAAVNAMVDFRGDTLFFTPGALSLAAVVAFDVANARYLGPKVGQPRSTRVTLTDAVGDHTIAANDVEFGYLTFVPLTAQNWFAVTTTTDRAWFHDFYYNADGITASTSTEFINSTGANEDWMIERFAVLVDGAQGDFLTLTSPQRWVMQDGDFWVEGGTWATAATFATTPIGNIFRRLHVNGSGASSVLTNFVTGVANSDMQLMMTNVFVNGTLMTTASAIETTFGTATDIDIAECYQTGDATGEGGVAIALA